MTKESDFMIDEQIYLVIGHRGTGKTLWVHELEKYFLQKNQKILIFDVDQEITRTTHQSISQLFEKGEKYFRKIENEIFGKCIAKARSFKGRVFISLGAGYKGGIPSFCKVIHLQRRSDQMGRVFFDRPGILHSLMPFEEYQSLYSKRKGRYKEQRDFVLTRLDYFKSFQKWDEIFLGNKALPFVNGVLTLDEKSLPLPEEKLNFFLDQRLKWGLKYFELKNNISEEFLKKILMQVPLDKILLSFRDKNSSLFSDYLNQTGNVQLNLDWPVEWGVEDKILNRECLEKAFLVYSLHERSHQSLNKVLDQFPKKQNAHLKLAVEIFSFEELWQAHLWWRKDPAHRSFHPRSREGRWKWYRLLFGPHQPLYFIREDYQEGVLDQPVMAESVHCGQGILEGGFACVLGNPIEHSATPYEQASFFKKYKLLPVPILMKEQEVHNKNMEILKNFGMKFAAITSPLKRESYQCLNAKEKLSINPGMNQNTQLVSSLNTLILTQKGFGGWNTDRDGALATRKFVEQSGFNRIAVWGGGAVRDLLEWALDHKEKRGVLDQKALDNIVHKFKLQYGYGFKNQKNKWNKNSISFYSARTGKLLKGAEQKPETVIWAVGRSRMPACRYPPEDWRPSYVLDLNYTEDSPGREYAIKTKSHYVPGWLWFKVQAQAQRVLFQRFFKPS